MLLPAGSLDYPDKAIEETKELVSLAKGTEQALDNPGNFVTESETAQELVQISWPANPGIEWLQESDFRILDDVESVLAVRANVDDSDVTYLHYAIEGVYIRNDWSLPHFDGDPELWHGAPVLSANDGKVVGVLYVDQHQARIVPYQPDRFGH